MKIAIVVHSQTGHTLSVAEKVRDRLSEAGHAASIERLMPVGGDQPNARTIELQSLPDVSQYDALVFAGPVRGMTASPVVTTCLTRVPSLADKKLACFVTQQFPFAWLGGNGAIAKMKSLCEAKQGAVRGTWVVNWSSGRRAAQIDDLVDGMGRLF